MAATQPSVTLLSDINAMGLVRRVVVQDSWLFVGTSGIDIYNVSQPTNPVKVAWINTATSDLALQDSFLYSVNSESLTVFNIASKTNPYRVGAVADSGEAIAVAGGKAYLPWGTFGWHGMYILDVSDPRAPHRAGVWNSTVGSVAARGNLCYASDAGRFHILDMTNPASPQELSSVGVGGNVYLDGNFAYLSSFAVIDIMDSLSPGIVGQCSLATEATMAVWTTGDYGYGFPSCLENGLAIVDYRDPVHPGQDTIGVLAYDDSRDIFVQGNHAIVANDRLGARILNVSDPAHPFEIAGYDTAGQPPECNSAWFFSSLGYMGWWGRDGWRGLYVISFADTASPTLLGRCATISPISAMTIRDSFLYAGCITKFQVLSIEDSSHPSVVSTCSLLASAETDDVCVSESLAYVANTNGGLRMISVADPHNATPIGSYAPPYWVWSVVAKDSIAYVGTSQDFRIVNVKNPLAPFVIGLFSRRRVRSRVFSSGATLHF